MDDFEGGTRVIIQAAHQARFQFEFDAAIGKVRFHLREVLAADVAEAVENGRQRVDDGLVGRDLAVQHAQRIGIHPAAAILAHVRRRAGERLFQLRHVLRAACRAAHRIEQQLESFQTRAP